MFLSELVSQYVLAQNNERPIGKELSVRTAGHLLDCAAVYSRKLGRQAEANDLTAVGINALLVNETNAGRSPYTVKNRRSGLRVLRNFALRRGLVADLGETIRRVHCPPLAVDGYDVAKMAALVEHAARLDGTVRKTAIPRNLWWESFLLTKWELGLRIGDLPRIEPRHFQRDGWLFVHESKTGKEGWLRIRPPVTAAIGRCLDASPGRHRIWPGYKMRTLFREFKRLAAQASVFGTSRYVRRGAGSEYEHLHPGGGWRFLRQSGPQVFENHYRIRRICDGDSPAPPEIPRAS